MDFSETLVLESGGNLLARYPEVDQLGPRGAVVLALRKRRDDPVRRSSGGLSVHSMYNPTLDLRAPFDH